MTLELAQTVDVRAVPRRPRRVRALTLAGLLALAAVLAACADRVDHGPVFGASAPAADLAPSDPRCAPAHGGPIEGCPCAGNQPPIACAPEGSRAELSPALCYEGTRRCYAGRFGACEDVRAFAPPALAVSALIDQVSPHVPCSPCENMTCFRAIDQLSPDDGPLDVFAQGLVHHDSGGGLTLAAGVPVDAGVPDAGVPAGSLFLDVPAGLTSSVQHTHVHLGQVADVYLLVDQSLSMGEETQWLGDHFAAGARYFDTSTRTCAASDASVADLGITGALRCMVRQPRFGAGMFRDIPFTPYAENQALPVEQRQADARAEIAFSHRMDLQAAPAQLESLGGIESSGDPDFAGSQIPALHALATGQGLYAGLERTPVLDGPTCDGGEGYACFAPDADRVVVLVTDAPMHNGPDPTYDYDAANLEMLVGTGPGPIAVPPTNDDFGSAYPLTSDAASALDVFVGSSAPLSAAVPASLVGCGASDAASDAVFSFDVVAPGGAGATADVRISAEGTRYASALAVFDAPPPALQTLPYAGDENELFASAVELGDVSGRAVSIAGDTTKPADASADMQADYQGSLFGAACDANTLAPDAVLALDVSGASGDTPVELSLEMGSAHAVLAVYEEGAGPLPRWPARQGALPASGNTDAFPANVFVIPSGVGNEYVSVAGSTSALDSDYAQADVGGGVCRPDSASRDAAFRIHVTGTQRLRFDTEGSSFDTVLSLHDRPPLTKAGSVLTWSAADTHQNLNETAQTAYDTGALNGLTQVFQGDTTGMRADVADTYGCGLDGACGDAVYRVEVSERTTVRLEVTGTGYEPGVIVTRADPNGVSGRYGPLAVGGAHSCAVSGGGVYCWGADDVGQLGNGGAAGAPDSTAPVRVTGISTALQACAGSQHACAVLTDGRVMCWGEGAQGRLGNGSDADRYVPVPVSELGPSGALGNAVQVVCGDAFSCALLSDGRAACWGDNTRSSLGDGTQTERRTPVLVSTAERFEQLDAGSEHSCAVRASDNAVFCWGNGAHGRLGDGATTDNAVPARVGTLAGVTHVMVGGAHGCAVLSSGQVQCWGRNDRGQLGRGSADGSDHATPALVRNARNDGTLANARSGWAAGRDHSCVATLEGFVQCWGDNRDRELGNDGSAGYSALPVGAYELLDALQVYAGYDHSCALRASGRIACWGRNADGQLGNGNTTTPSRPVAAQPGSGDAAVSFGTGTVDAAFTQACRSIAQPPEEGCELQRDGTRDYFVCAEQARTWSGAGQACESVGMRLAEIDSPGENAFIGAQLPAGERAWIGVKRESSDDWLDLGEEMHFENLDGERVWYTSATRRCTRRFLGACIQYEDHVQGSFVGPAPSDLVDSDPTWSSSSTWASREQPSTEWGYNCVTIDSGAHWATDNCSAVPEPADCGFLGLGCLLGFLGDLIGGVLDWIVPWLGDLVDLVRDSAGGLFVAPHFSGGVNHGYVCEEQDSTTEITLDPGEYFITIKGIQDGTAGNACEGPYELRITDLGTPGGGFLACDDDGVAETRSSAIERTLTEGDYYLILKGKGASDEGDYLLTVRDVGAVATQELACDASTGVGDPARVSFVADPTKRYYALVKGDAPLDKGAYALSARDSSVGSGMSLACDAQSSESGDPELTLPLSSGRYFAVLKGSAAGEAGDYRLTLGAAAPRTATFTPPTYTQTVDALQAAGVRVATVLSCDGAPCDDARDQALALAADTQGTLRQASRAADVPREIVRAVELLERADEVRAEMVFAPDPNPGFVVGLSALPDLNNGCIGGAALTSFSQCMPGAHPSFLVAVTNPALSLIPPVLTDALGAYAFTLRVTSTRDGAVVEQQDVPVLVRPSELAPAGSFGTGTYFQDLDSRGCDADNLRPSWDALHFDADVRPDTWLSFSACTADTLAELADCERESGDDSGYQRVVTVTAGSGAGAPCTVETQAVDCPFGYCSPYTQVCNELEGAACEQDADCPGSEEGRCRRGPSFDRLGMTCRVRDVAGDPASALDAGNFRAFMRVRAELHALGDGSRAPSLFFWEARYRCRAVE